MVAGAEQTKVAGIALTGRASHPTGVWPARPPVNSPPGQSRRPSADRLIHAIPCRRPSRKQRQRPALPLRVVARSTRRPSAALSLPSSAGWRGRAPAISSSIRNRWPSRVFPDGAQSCRRACPARLRQTSPENRWLAESRFSQSRLKNLPIATFYFSIFLEFFWIAKDDWHR
jgi:hypothetical protein